MIKHSMFVFINSLISNPSFDSQTKETLTTRHTKFGPPEYKPSINENFLKNVIKSCGLIDEVLHYAKAKQNRQLAKKMGGTKSKKLIVPKLDDANNAGGRKSAKCTLILTEGKLVVDVYVSIKSFYFFLMFQLIFTPPHPHIQNLFYYHRG
jgi:DNA topoisomerase II